ncbi:hypothetical protein PZA11_002126 [Diplocarpon coronariae]
MICFARGKLLVSLQHLYPHQSISLDPAFHDSSPMNASPSTANSQLPESYAPKTSSYPLIVNRYLTSLLCTLANASFKPSFEVFISSTQLSTPLSTRNCNIANASFLLPKWLPPPPPQKRPAAEEILRLDHLPAPLRRSHTHKAAVDIQRLQVRAGIHNLGTARHADNQIRFHDVLPVPAPVPVPVSRSQAIF